jgi:hypothetical protein
LFQVSQLTYCSLNSSGSTVWPKQQAYLVKCIFSSLPSSLHLFFILISNFWHVNVYFQNTCSSDKIDIQVRNPARQNYNQISTE